MRVATILLVQIYIYTFSYCYLATFSVRYLGEQQASEHSNASMFSFVVLCFSFLVYLARAGGYVSIVGRCMRVP